MFIEPGLPVSFRTSIIRISVGGLVGPPLIDKNRSDIDYIDMNPHQLELFYHVAKFKGVSRAARQMPYGIQSSNPPSARR
jgi:hypothetical protein